MTSLNEGIGELHSVLETAGDYLSPEVVERARNVLARARDRRATGEDLTVVALAGATGTGKSSLINAIVGEKIARVAATRPTTSAPKAIYNADASATLDWLGVPERHHMPDLATRLGGEGSLVLLDLPDIDSTNASNRDIAARLTELVDVVVWVLDPQKYADAVVHEDYFSRLGEHADVMITVLNQADRLSDAEREPVMDNLRSILRSNGIETDVVATSALTGQGLPELRSRIIAKVSEKNAALEKLAADVRTSGRELAGDALDNGGRDPHSAEEIDFSAVARGMAKAGGSQVVARATAQSYTHRARKATGWPVTRWMRNSTIDPLKRLHLDRRQEEGEVAPVTGVVVNESLRTQSRVELRGYIERSTQHLPRPWALDVQEDMDDRAEASMDRVDGVIASTDLEARRNPAWWTIVNVLQWLVLITAVVGGVWLALMFFGDTLQLRLPEPPYFGIFPLPTILLVGGILVGWILTLVSRAAIKRGAARTADRVQRRLDSAIEAKVSESVLVPLRERLAQYEQFYDSTRRLSKVTADK